MPVSNGQISRYDIRRGAVQEAALVDQAVSTAKLADLAVTLEKDQEVRFIHAVGHGFGSGAALTTTPTQFVADFVDIPSWVGQLFVYATAHVIYKNDVAGSGYYLVAEPRLNGEGGAGTWTTVTADWTLVTAVDVFADVDLGGSTIELSTWSWLSHPDGNNSNLRGYIHALVFGER